jgi:superkiller protein 3
LFGKIALLVLDTSDDSLKAKEEQAWSHWQATHNDIDIQSLKCVFDILDGLDEREHDAARCLWRIGRCLWDQTSMRLLSYFVHEPTDCP